MASLSKQEVKPRQWAAWLITAILVGAVIIYLLLWYGPDVLARHDIGHVSGPLRALRMQQARDAARGRLLTFGAGLFAAGALVFTGRNYRLARQTLEVTKQGQQRTLELTEQGQVTERYTRAIEQMGSDKLDVRIGGIYALERIARDSLADRTTVIDVLAAFVRQHSGEPWPAPGQAAGGSILRRATRADVQAAITIIGRPGFRDGQASLDLTDVTLARANLVGADLIRADLTGADLFRAHLAGADLTGAALYRVDLTDADLAGATLTGAWMYHANLLRVDLTAADLTGADLTNADLTSAILTDATFTNADLTDTKMSPAAAHVPAGWEQDDGSHRLTRTH